MNKEKEMLIEFMGATRIGSDTYKFPSGNIYGVGAIDFKSNWNWFMKLWTKIETNFPHGETHAIKIAILAGDLNTAYECAIRIIKPTQSKITDLRLEHAKDPSHPETIHQDYYQYAFHSTVMIDVDMMLDTMNAAMIRGK